MNKRALDKVLSDVVGLLKRSGNNFSLSPWDGPESASREVKASLGSINADDNLTKSKKLFAPFGPIHQVSIMSGWVPAFLETAKRFDRSVWE